MKRALIALVLIAGAVLTTAAGCPGQNPKPVPTYTPEPAWSWPYGSTTKAADPIADAGRIVASFAPPPAAVTTDFTWTPVTTPVRKRVIEVVDKIGPAKWNVRQAMDWLDRYTASDMRLVKKCSGRAWRCVTLRGGKLPGGYLGLTKGNSITIDTAKVDRHGYRSNLRREQILAHELFHTYGYGHSGSGHNLMRPRISQITLYLTAGQRRFLASR